ncbi:DUF3857 domain-containing protein [Mucilaginibacter gotjawali]|uniref:DUF3857 domain-containing protein n=1 Tax=Mucilaginibacter gotjawali TaxID=1550579 RepID=A0A839SE25_9SPHI|nr:DUF3857 domain-containing protein [Mucilaginibacter gotjawali]MBB3054797.1 hypothetical protein [Mucilaginibacter gotjawali]
MNKPFALLILCIFHLSVNAQTSVPKVQAYGKINMADLEMMSCDFEKDANAEVLQEKGTVYFGPNLSTITEEIYKRIKIFNNGGKNEANINIEYFSGDHLEYITGIQAETINLVNGKIEITKLDKSLIYNKPIDKYHSEVAFSFPNVASGSIIEYKYKWNSNTFVNFPNWYFQENIPVRYSEFNTSIPDVFYFRSINHVNQPFAKEFSSKDATSTSFAGNTVPYNFVTEQKVMVNVNSLTNEPYMSSYYDNLQAVRFQLVSIKSVGSYERIFSDTWAKVAGVLRDDKEFGGQLKARLNNDEAIVNKAMSFKTDREKIAYIFNEVKSEMTWDGTDEWRTNDGVYESWQRKTGNSAEINLILYHFLQQAGVTAYPMIVSTRDHGKVDRYFTSLVQFNRTVVFIIDSSKNYVLDAAEKNNSWYEIPENLLNSWGLYINNVSNSYKLIELKKSTPVSQSISVDADINSSGTLQGTAVITSDGYNKLDAVNLYKSGGEKNYINYLENTNSNLKITALDFENTDTSQLIQKIHFNSNLTGPDDKYIYLKTNLFSNLKNNPFLSENRTTDIDFGYCKNYNITAVYRIPREYEIVSSPTNISMDDIPDQSVSLKYDVTTTGSIIKVNYSIHINKPELSNDYYPAYYKFFKKMYEMLNEQVVLKKL